MCAGFPADLDIMCTLAILTFIILFFREKSISKVSDLPLRSCGHAPIVVAVYMDYACDSVLVHGMEMRCRMHECEW